MLFDDPGYGETFKLTHAAFENHGVAIAHEYAGTIDVYTGPLFKPSFMMILRRRSPEVAVQNLAAGQSLVNGLPTAPLRDMLEAFTDVENADDWWRDTPPVTGVIRDAVFGDTLVERVEDDIARGRIQVYRFARDEAHRLFDPEDPLFTAPDGLDQLDGNAESARRRELAQELGRILARRWAQKDAADNTLYQQSLPAQFLTYTGGFMSGAYDAAAGAVEGALSGIVMGVEIVADAIANMDAVDWARVITFAAGGPSAFVATLSASQWQSVQEAMAELGATIEGGWERVKALAEQGAEFLETLMSDPRTRRILTDFLIGYADSFPDIQMAYAAGALVGGIAVEVLVTLGLVAISGGSAAFARIAASVGRFTKKAIELMAELATLLRRARVASSVAETMDDGPSGPREIMPPPWRRNRDNDRDKADGPEPRYRPPANLSEAVDRLQQQRERIKRQGRATAAAPRYSDSELKAMAEEAKSDGIDDRYIVRLTKRKYMSDDSNMAPVDENGNAKVWTAPLKTVEPGDTDPKALHDLLGKSSDYDPDADYSVAVVDLNKSNLREEASTFVPTHKNMAEFAKKEFDRLDPDRIDEVMSDDYVDTYAEARRAMDEAGHKVNDPADTYDFSIEHFDSTAEQKRFRTRAAIERRLGANPEFLGKGVTQYGGKGQDFGSLETFTFDRKPRTYEQMNGVKRLNAEPVSGD